MTAQVRRDPEFLRFYIGVLMREARSRRHMPGFHATLLSWVAKARAEIAASKANRAPLQGDLFGGGA